MGEFKWCYVWVKYVGQGEELFLHECTLGKDGKPSAIGGTPTTLIADNKEGTMKLLDMIITDTQSMGVCTAKLDAQGYAELVAS